MAEIFVGKSFRVYQFMTFYKFKNTKWFKDLKYLKKNFTFPNNKSVRTVQTKAVNIAMSY